MNKKITLSVLLVFAIYFCNAQNIFKDDFSSYGSVQLAGQGTWNNNSSISGLGSCIPPGTCSNSAILNVPVSYLNYGSSLKSLAIVPNTDGVGTLFPAVTSGDVYVGFVINLSVTQANDNSDFIRVASGNNFTTSFRLYATPAGLGGFYLGVSKGANGNPISFSINPYNTNQDHLVIIKYAQFSGTNDDVVSVYIDPVFADGVPTVPTITTSIGGDQSGNLDRLIFRLNWLNGMPTGRAGLVSVAKTWPDLRFMSLSNNNFEKSTFSIITNNIKSGILSVKSTINLEKASLKIFNIEGRNLASKTISLAQDINQITINPILNSGVYIVEITGDNKKFVKKIIVE